MQAVRQIQKVTNRSVTVQLPADFQADEVEIIVLPVQRQQNDINQDAKRVSQNVYNRTLQNFLMMDTSHLTEEQKIAYTRTCTLLQQGRTPEEPLTLDLFEGLIEVADDFDAPLPDDIIDLFYGAETDEYGLSLS